MNKLIVKAPAKINIGLNIVAKRKDGFHDLETIFYPIYDLYDEIKFENSDSFIFQNDYEFENIIVKAVRLLERHTGCKIKIKISLEKNIPIGAGLGGGSSDAAAVLGTLNKILKLNLRYEELSNIALEIGSDVPYFLVNKPSVGKSRGEDLTPIDLSIDSYILLVNPGIHISTKEAFSNITPMPNEFDYHSITKINLKNYNKYILNDFEQSIFHKHPHIRKIKDDLYSSGALFSSMSGTGSTVYGIFQTKMEAENALKSFPENYFTFISHPIKPNELSNL